MNTVNEAKWNKKAQDLLLGRTITQVSYMGTDEAENMGFYRRTVAIVLDNKTIVFASADDEGNDAGALFLVKNDKLEILPVL